MLPSGPFTVFFLFFSFLTDSTDGLADRSTFFMLCTGVMLTPVLCMALVEFTVKAHYQ